eukprot:2753429-Ditylum_brightwellii.AAC.1
MVQYHTMFQTEEVFKQSQHSYGMQKNEGMSISVARFAPKKRFYSTSMSLQNRVNIVVGLKIVAMENFGLQS